MQDKTVGAIFIVTVLVLAIVLAGVLGSCANQGDAYYHIPGTDTHKSKTVKPKSGWPVPKVTTRKR